MKIGDIIYLVETLLSRSTSVLANGLKGSLLKASPDNIHASIVLQ